MHLELLGNCRSICSWNTLQSCNTFKSYLPAVQLDHAETHCVRGSRPVQDERQVGPGMKTRADVQTPRFEKQAVIQETGAPNSENKPESSGMVRTGFNRRAATYALRFWGSGLGLACGTWMNLDEGVQA